MISRMNNKSFVVTIAIMVLLFLSVSVYGQTHIITLETSSSNKQTRKTSTDKTQRRQDNLLDKQGEDKTKEQRLEFDAVRMAIESNAAAEEKRLANIVVDNTYVSDEIEYKYEKPTQADLKEWKSKYQTICRGKIKELLEARLESKGTKTRHKVKKKETFDSIAREYSVTIDQLIDANADIWTDHIHRYGVTAQQLIKDDPILIAKKLSSLMMDKYLKKDVLLRIPYSYGLDIPSEMSWEDPCLIYLLLISKSTKQEEKQQWFDMYPIMNEEQIDKLYDILYRESYKLAEIETKYRERDEILAMVNNKQPLSQIKSHHGWAAFLTPEERFSVEVILDIEQYKGVTRKVVEDVLASKTYETYDEVVDTKNKIWMMLSKQLSN